MEKAMTTDLTTTLTARLTAMSDLAISRFFEHWSTELCDGASTDLESITAGVPDEIRRLDFFGDVTDISAEDYIDPSTTPAVARAVLLPLAHDPQMAPTMAAALETFDDDKLLVEVILALGLVASVLLIVSATEFDGSIGKFKFHKGKVDPETIKTVVDGVFGLVK